jgi:tetratricopeptide (TPR) repeat protein
MRRRTLLAALPLAALLAGGCVATKPSAVTPGSSAHVLEDVPVRRFGVQRCGAGSLSAVLNYHGDPVGLDELDAALPRGRHGGVITLDMLLAARARGFSARLVEGSPRQVTEELLAGRPVILMVQVLDSVGAANDLFHYLVLDGVDPAGGLVRLQWGDGRPVWTTFDKLERSWGKTRHATLLIAPGGDGGDERRHALRYAVALEEEGRSGEAAALYRDLLAGEDADGAAAVLWTNLGNAEMAAGRTAEAEAAYREALARDPDSADALNNLAWLLYEEGERLPEAAELARRAVARGGPDVHLAHDTLGRILRAAGDCAGAVAALEAARDSAPAAAAALDALFLELALAERDCGDAAWRPRLEDLAASAADPEVAAAARRELGGL